jgi:GTP cyclohydrolase IA
LFQRYGVFGFHGLTPVGICARDQGAGGLGSQLPSSQGFRLENMKASPVNDHSDIPGASKDLPVSERIRKRLRRNKLQFLANDNISSVIEPGEMDALLDEVAAKMKGVLESLVIDVDHDHNTQDTARRVAKMYLNEVFRGRYAPAPTVTEFPNAASLNELMIVGPITVRSACSHHFCPIMGRVWFGVMPNQHSNLIGLSKYARLTDWIMSRPQIQEEAITQLAELVVGLVKPDGLAIVMEADHFCMHWRGVKDTNAKMINSVMRGSFLKNSALRREFLALISPKL